ncbi:hypothetical protein GCM10008164_00920 [Achromobacter xylosoxidans]|nr:hypothetical protein GCM10008164_00920 [Achromobacter xylosoxidans]
MNVHGFQVSAAAIDAAWEFMRTGRPFDCKALAKVIGRHFPFSKATMSREGHGTVCHDAAYRLMRQARTDLELVRRGFRTEHHHYRWRTRPQQ